MKKYTFLLIILTLITLLEPAMAQSRKPRYKRNIPIWYRSRFYTAVGGGVGVANYYGDLSPTPSLVSLDLKFTQPSFNVFVTHKFTPRITGRAELAYQRLRGDDNTSADPTKANSIGRYMRNLHFRNDIIELSATGLFDLFENNNPFFKRSTWSPYAFLGVGVIYSNPQAKTPSDNASGMWTSLRPLQTEGKSYSPAHIVVPFGLGVRYKASQRIDIGFEAGIRFTFTDYLDDVSGKYVDPNNLSSDLARTMADRNLEKFGAATGQSRKDQLQRIALANFGITDADTPSYDPFNPATAPSSGSRRGDPKDNDWYLTTGFHISYILVNVVQRPRFR
ncbi:MAG: DUF6089 family protein [Bacteroidota bacterium]